MECWLDEGVSQAKRRDRRYLSLCAVSGSSHATQATRHLLQSPSSTVERPHAWRGGGGLWIASFRMDQLGHAHRPPNERTRSARIHAHECGPTHAHPCLSWQGGRAQDARGSRLVPRGERRLPHRRLALRSDPARLLPWRHWPPAPCARWLSLLGRDRATGSETDLRWGVALCLRTDGMELLEGVRSRSPVVGCRD